MALVLGLAGVLSFATVSQAAGPSPAKSQTLVFDAAFSPLEVVQANNARNPHSPFALSDEIVAHDQLFSHGQRVSDDAFSGVIVSVPPDPVLVNCTGIFRLPGGAIAFQTTAVPGSAPKELAVTGGIGTYRNAGGDGTLVEFGNAKGETDPAPAEPRFRGGGA